MEPHMSSHVAGHVASIKVGQTGGLVIDSHRQSRNDWKIPIIIAYNQSTIWGYQCISHLLKFSFSQNLAFFCDTSMSGQNGWPS